MQNYVDIDTFDIFSNNSPPPASDQNTTKSTRYLEFLIVDKRC